MEEKWRYKSSSLTLPRCLGDRGVFMKCGFLGMVRFDARVKHGSEIFQFLLSFVRKGEADRNRFLTRGRIALLQRTKVYS